VCSPQAHPGHGYLAESALGGFCQVTYYYGFLGYFAKLASSIDSLLQNLRASAIWTSTGRKGTLGSGSLVCPSVTGFGVFT